MATREIIRGDSYPAFYRLTLTDSDGNPFDLTSCTVRTTYKTEVTDPNTDTTDSTAVIKHFIEIDGAGAEVDSDGLSLGGAVTDGILIETVARAETLALSLSTEYISDVELTVGGAFVISFLYLSDPIVAIDGVTNRTVD